MDVLAAIADPTRRRIVEMLAVRERTAGEIVAAFDLTAPAISQHLKVLRDVGLVNVRVEGQRRIQVLNPTGLEKMESWLSRTMRFWERRLDSLERELRAEDRKKS
jgi:DNA-binding transcriptional ArsR family regulator